MEQKFVISGPPESRHKQRKLGILHYVPPPGAIKVLCDKCGDKLWIGPKQREARKDPNVIGTVCSGCMIEMAKKSGERPDIKNLGGVGGSYLLDG